MSVHDWRQFSNVEIDLSRQTTILTGPNGCGKTTLLNILSKHFGWNLSFISTPYFSSRKGKKLYSDFLQIKSSEHRDSNAGRQIGTVEYDNGVKCALQVPADNEKNPQYQLIYSGESAIRGLHIPSHRPAITFQRIEQIPTNPKTNQQQYEEFQQLLLQTYGAPRSGNPGVVLKQSLISMALFGYGNSAVAPDPQLRDLYEDFQEKLRVMLPRALGFRRIEVRMPDIILVTSTGDFSLDSMSGGVNSVFGIAWQIHMYTADSAPCTVIIDEPENHLHPSMQRTLLPDLASAFPKHKFIVATHSPFVVASTQEAAVYTLQHSPTNQIVSRQLSEANLASSPDDILRDVLDVPISIPVWVEKKITEVFRSESHVLDPAERAERIYQQLRKDGLVAALPTFKLKKDGEAE